MFFLDQLTLQPDKDRNYVFPIVYQFIWEACIEQTCAYTSKMRMKTSVPKIDIKHDTFKRNIYANFTNFGYFTPHSFRNILKVAH